MTDISGALNNPNFDDRKIILDCEDSKYVYISRLEIFDFRTSDKTIEYISLMGKYITPFVFALGMRYTNFITTHYKFFENDEIEEGTLLTSSDDSLDPYDYLIWKNRLDCLKKLLECNRIHSSWNGMECGFMAEVVKDEEDDEKDVKEDVKIHQYTEGSNEVQ